jgi:ketosteroid isomerase-like protein
MAETNQFSERRSEMRQQEQSNHQVDVEALNHVREAHIAALNDGDVNAWVAAFTDDGVQMPPNAPANLGREMSVASLFAAAITLKIPSSRRFTTPV